MPPDEAPRGFAHGAGVKADRHPPNLALQNGGASPVENAVEIPPFRRVEARVKGLVDNIGGKDGYPMRLDVKVEAVPDGLFIEIFFQIEMSDLAERVDAASVRPEP